MANHFATCPVDSSITRCTFILGMTLALGATYTVSVGKATKCPLRKCRAKRSKRPSSCGLGIGKLASHQQREGLEKVGETVKIQDKCKASKIDNFPNDEVSFNE